MIYNPKLGMMGNLNALFTAANKTNNTVQNNKISTDQSINDSVEGLLEVAELASEDMDAIAELGELVSELYERVLALEEELGK